jgi:hypothetical protein
MPQLSASSAMTRLPCQLPALSGAEFQRHEQVVFAWLIAGERAARDEARAVVQRPGRGECRRGPGLQADSPHAARACYPEQVGEHGSPDSAASRSFGGVHRLDLRMIRAEALDRSDGEQAAAQPEAEESNSRIAQRVRVEREAVLRRGLPERERPVPFQQRPHVRLTRVIHGDQAASHHAANVNGL